MAAPQQTMDGVQYDSRSVFVTNISPAATEKTVSDFFSFCGKIVQLFLKKEEQKDTHSAIIQFETESAAKTALLLSNALIVDRPITVASYIISTNPPSPVQPHPSPDAMGPPVEATKITQRDFGTVPDSERTKTSTVASILAAGYILANDALEKAKDYDVKHDFSHRAKVVVDSLVEKVHEIDVQYGITDKATAAKNSAIGTAKKLDEEYKISEKANQAATTIKQTAQATYQKVQENVTVKKGVDAVVSTGQKVSSTVTNTFNDVRAQTNQVIAEKNQEKAAASAATAATISEPVSTTTTDAPVAEPQQQ